MYGVVRCSARPHSHFSYLTVLVSVTIDLTAIVPTGKVDSDNSEKINNIQNAASDQDLHCLFTGISIRSNRKKRKIKTTPDAPKYFGSREITLDIK